jgi:hypothetical protein
MIESHLYGELRRQVHKRMIGNQSMIRLCVGENETVGGALHGLGIDPALVGQIFLNRKLLSSRCSMAPWLGYQSADERVPIGHSYLDAPLRSGDRLAVFPTRMAMLVV